MVPEKVMENVAKSEPKWSQNGSWNQDKIEKYLEKRMPKSIQKNGTFQKVPKIGKMDPRWDFEPKRAATGTTEYPVFGNQAPRERPPVHARVKRKKGSGRKKEEARKKERKGTR